jgi:hypothetical protein
MEAFKIKHFSKENPGLRFPLFRSVDRTETELLRNELTRRIGLPDSVSGVELVEEIARRGKELATLDSLQEPLCDLVKRAGVLPARLVYLNWGRYDSLDEMDFADLQAHIRDIWYPGSDDLDVFDKTMDWILSIAHHGAISLLRLPRDA